MAMLCGAPSWLSKTRSNAVSALTVTAVGANFMSLATIVDGIAAGVAGRCGRGGSRRRRAGTGGQHGGQREQAEGEGQALHVGRTPVVMLVVD